MCTCRERGVVNRGADEEEEEEEEWESEKGGEEESCRGLK